MCVCVRRFNWIELAESADVCHSCHWCNHQKRQFRFFFHMVASYLLHFEYILYICKRKNLPIGPNPCAAKQRKKKKTRKIHRFIIDSNAYLLLNIANGDLLDIPLAELIYNGKEIKEYLLHCSRKLGLASKRRNRRKKISCKVEELKELWCKLM